MPSSEAAQLLKETPLFSGFEPKEIEALIKTAKERAFSAHQTIVREGDVGGLGFYLVLEGQVEVRKGKKTLTRLGKGEFFGEMALLEDAPRSADVAAIANTRCLVLTRWDVRGLISTYPDVALKMLRELARRLRETNQALSE